ncbi:MAG: glycosyltransferase family 4 protein [Phycisphaerae bacterium]|nr:glycosyltransferase family 4 protein [Phycisphaerae bacterium]
MKTALVIEWIDAWRGGAETSTEQFIRHLLQRGVELTVFTRSRPSPTPDLRVCTIPTSTPARSQRTRRFAQRAAAAVRAEQFDIVHAISPCLVADVYEPRGGTVAETVLRNLATRQPGLRRELKRAANKFNLKQRVMLKFERRLLGGEHKPMVIALSDYVVRQLRQHYDYPSAYIRKVFNGVDPDRTEHSARQKDRADIRELYHIRQDDYLVIMVAHNFRLKGVRRWLEAFRILAEGTDLPLRSLVIGRDASMLWERLVAREGLSERIQFTGPTRRVLAFLHAADVLVHPTYYDPCSRVVLEAMAVGLPVITTRYDGASEIVEDGVNGFVLEEADCVRTLVDRVVHLADAEVRAGMRVEALKAADRVSMKQHAEGVYQVYQEVLEAR